MGSVVDIRRASLVSGSARTSASHAARCDRGAGRRDHLHLQLIDGPARLAGVGEGEDLIALVGEGVEDGLARRGVRDTGHDSRASAVHSRHIGRFARSMRDDAAPSSCLRVVGRSVPARSGLAGGAAKTACRDGAIVRGTEPRAAP